MTYKTSTQSLSDLATGLREGRFALFLGEGFSAQLGYRTHERLPEVLLAHFPREVLLTREAQNIVRDILGKNPGGDTIADEVLGNANMRERLLSGLELGDIVSDLLDAGIDKKKIVDALLDNLKPDEAKQDSNLYILLAEIIDQCPKPFYIFTTNWEAELDEALGDSGVLYVRGDEDISELLTKFSSCHPRIIVVKVHGDRVSRKLILTASEASRSLEEKRELYGFFAGKLLEKGLLIMGYGMLGPDIIELCRFMRKGVPSSADYLMIKGDEPLQNVQYVRDDVSDFVPSLYKSVTGKPFLNESLKVVDARLQKLITTGRPLVVRGCKHSGKTRLKQRLMGSLSRYEPVDVPDTSNEDDYRRVRNAIEAHAVANGKAPLVLLSHGHADLFQARYKEDTGKNLFGGMSRVELELSKNEAKDVLLKAYVRPELYRELLKHRALCDKIIEYSSFKEGVFPVQYSTHLPSIIAHVAEHLNDNEHIKKAFNNSPADDRLLEECFRKEEKELDTTKKHRDALCEALAIPGSVLFGAVAELVGNTSKVISTGGISLGGLLSPVVAAVPFLNLVGLGAVGVSIILGIWEWKNGRKNSPLCYIVKAASHWNRLSDVERRIVAYQFERKGALEPETAYDFLESLLSDSRSQQLSQSINDYFRNNPNVWDDFLNSREGKGLEEESVQEAVAELAKKLDSRLNSMDRAIKKLQDQVNEHDERIEALEEKQEESNGIYRRAEGLGIRWRDSEYFFGTAGEHKLVRSEEYDELADQIFHILQEGKRVVLSGNHGLGKSLLGRYALGRQLPSGIQGVLAVHEVARAKVKHSIEEGTRANLILFYDPSGPEVYYSRRYAGTEFENLRASMTDIIGDIVNSGAPSLVVLPSDIWTSLAIPATLRDEFVAINPEKELTERGFLLNVTIACAGSTSLEGDIEGLLSGIREGGPLIAAYSGTWLRENGLRIVDVTAALNAAKGDPIRFLQSFVLEAILKNDWDKCQSFAFPLIVHNAFGEISSELARKLPLAFERLHLRELEPLAARWISTVHEDLMEESLRRFVEDAGASSTNLSQAIIDVLDQLDELFRVPKQEHEKKRKVSIPMVPIFIRRWMLSSISDSGDVDAILDLYARTVLGQTDSGPDVSPASQSGPPSEAVRMFFFSDRDYRTTYLGRSMLLGDWTRHETPTDGILQYLTVDPQECCSELKTRIDEYETEGKQQDLAKLFVWASLIAYSEAESPGECLCLSMDTAVLTLHLLHGSSPESERVHRGVGIRLADKLQTDRPEQARSLARYLLEVSRNRVWENVIYSRDLIQLRSLAEKSSDWVTVLNVLETLLNCYIITAEGSLRRGISSQITKLVNRAFTEEPKLGANGARLALLVAAVGLRLVRFFRDEASYLQMEASLFSGENRKEAAKMYQRLEEAVAHSLSSSVSILEELSTQTPDKRQDNDLLRWLRNEFLFTPEERLGQIFSHWLRHRKIGILSLRANSIEVKTEDDALHYESLLEEVAKSIEELGEGKTQDGIYANQIALLAGYHAGDKTSVPTISPFDLLSLEAEDLPPRSVRFSEDFFGFATACYLIFSDSLDIVDLRRALIRFQHPLHRLRLISALTYGIICLKFLYRTGKKEEPELRLFENQMAAFAYQSMLAVFKPCFRLLLGKYHMDLPHRTRLWTESVHPILDYEEALKECVTITLAEVVKLGSQSEGGAQVFTAEDGRLSFVSRENESVPLGMHEITNCREILEGYRRGNLRELLLNGEYVKFGHHDFATELFGSLDDRMALMATSLLGSTGGVLLLIIQFLLNERTDLVDKLCVQVNAETLSRRSEDLRNILLKKLGQFAKEGRQNQVLDHLVRLSCTTLVLPSV